MPGAVLRAVLFHFSPHTPALLVRGRGGGRGCPGKCYPLDEQRGAILGSEPWHDVVIDGYRRTTGARWLVHRDGTRWLYRVDPAGSAGRTGTTNPSDPTNSSDPPDHADDEPVDSDDGPTWLRSGDTVAVGPRDALTLFTFLEGGDPEPAYRRLVRSQGLFLDPVTGLFHRSYLRHAVVEHGHDICRVDGSLWALLVDIDHFKRLNDVYGFAVGDAVLGHVAAILCRRVYGHALAGHALSAARPLEADRFCGRYGGEELAVLLRDVSGERAAAVAESIRGEVAATTCEVNDIEVAVTVSIGVVEWQVPWIGQALWRRLDNAMYAAKLGGRDQVFVTGPCT